MNRSRFMTSVRGTVLLVALAGAVVCAIPAAEGYEAANPSLSGLAIEVTVRPDPGGWYEYSYVLRNAAPSTGALTGFSVDVRGEGSQTPPPSDGNGRVFENRAQVGVLPVGFLVPEGWAAGVDRSGFARWSMDTRDGKGMPVLETMAPGATSPPLVLRSFAPPGLRTYFADPFWSSMDPATTAQTSLDVRRTGEVIGPVPTDSDPGTLFRGGSNNPAVVDRFLSYRLPAQKTTVLPAGERALVVVLFGPTIDPSTFEAKWNGQVVTDRFTVVPGQFAVVQFDPIPGRNLLDLRITGTKPSGGLGTDADRLLWEAP